MRIYASLVPLLSTAVLVAAEATFTLQDQSLRHDVEKRAYKFAGTSNAVTISVNGKADDKTLNEHAFLFYLQCSDTKQCFKSSQIWEGKLADGIGKPLPFTTPTDLQYELFYALTNSTELVKGDFITFKESFAVTEEPVVLIKPDFTAQVSGPIDAKIVAKKDKYCVNDEITVRYDFSKLARNVPGPGKGPIVVLSELRGNVSGKTDHISETLIALDNLSTAGNVLKFVIPEKLAGRNNISVWTSVQFFAGLYNEGEQYVDHTSDGDFEVASAADCKVVVPPPPEDCGNATTTTTKTVPPVTTTPCSTTTSSVDGVGPILASGAASGGLWTLPVMMVASVATLFAF